MANDLSRLALAGRQFHLPGMSGKEIAAAHPQNHRGNNDFLPTDKEWEESKASRSLARSRAESRVPVKDNWSGPDLGQRVMGVHDLAENSGQIDPHGFVHEPRMSMVNNPIANRAGADFKSPDNLGLGRAGDGVEARGFYKTVGGSHSEKPHVQEHWNSQPLHQIPSDAPIHTGQYWDLETEKGNDHFGLHPGVSEGRARINEIRGSMEKRGFDESQAPWIMKHNNRLYALDGHHRIVAAREAGLSSFPARVWDRDAEREALKPGKAKPKPPIAR